MTQTALTGLAHRIAAHGFLSEAELVRAQQQAKRANTPLSSFLIERKMMPTAAICRLGAEEFGIPFFDLDAMEWDADAINLVDEKLINQFHALPLWKRESRLFVAIADPANLQALDQFQFHSGLITSPVLVEAEKLNKAIDEALESSETHFSQFEDVELEKLEFATEEDSEFASSDAEVDDAPLVRFVNKILLEAINKGASDIHLEPYENDLRIRYRIDGILQEMSTPPPSLASRLAARIKVMARLDISERRIPQDGRIKMKLSRNRSIDFRVSSCPTLFGEKIVLRILDSGNLTVGLNTLGFTAQQKEAYLSAIHKPYGMILVTGPTGSGKTVTLYNAIAELNTNERNISTVEDPAEIYMPGINQVNVNSKIGLTFATALRAFLRQDPDIIMIGEVRDFETAEIAVKAAQTGHLVLSTLHTNDAPQALTRLRTMGIEPYNIVSAVNLIIAQRLVRKLCNHCKHPVDIPLEGLIAAGFSEEQANEITVFGPVGCDQCTGGYKDRTGIFQVMPISEDMARIIMADGNSLEIAEQARKEGILDMRASGLLKVAQGVTSLEEVNRVTLE